MLLKHRSKEPIIGFFRLAFFTKITISVSWTVIYPI